MINITGNLTVTGLSHIVLNRVNTNLPPGTVYPLIAYSGTFSGSLANFDLSGLTGIPAVLTNLPGQIALSAHQERSRRDDRGEREYERRTEGMGVEQAAAVAVQMTVDRKREETAAPAPMESPG